MKEITITHADENRRLDKYLQGLMNKAPRALIYKFLRTKKIKLNRGRAEGSELLKTGDSVSIYISDDILSTCMAEVNVNAGASGIEVIYEDNNILICEKPPGVLSHPEKPGDRDTMIDRVLSYLVKTGSYKPSPDSSFTPALCNRLDRNTGGLILCGKTIAAAQEANEAIRLRHIEKRYCALVQGEITKNITLSSHLTRNTRTNKTTSSEVGKLALAKLTPIAGNRKRTLVDLELITGRTHQLRAQLSEIGHPICGDIKYGAPAAGLHGYYRLFAYALRFRTKTGLLSYLNEKTFKAKKPEWANISREEDK